MLKLFYLRQNLLLGLVLAGLFAATPFPARSQEFNTDIYALDHILEVKIEFDRPDWDEQLDRRKRAGKDDRLVGTVYVDGEEFAGAGIRYKGNSSYFGVRQMGFKKLPFNVKVNYTDKEHKLPGGFTSLKLSNVFRDPTYLREVMTYEIASKYMPAPRANFARVYVNDEYLGLYHLTQSVDDDLLEKFYGNDDGTLIKCDPNHNLAKPTHCPESDKASLQYLGPDSLCYFPNYEPKSKDGLAKLIPFIEILNQDPDALDSVLNIDETLWMLALNNTLVNLDSYLGRLCHNYYLYRDTFGVWHPIIWDMNLSFGGFRYTGLGRPLTDEKLPKLSMFLHYKEQNDRRPLITQLLGNELYRKIYVAHIRTIVEENFAEGQYLTTAEEIRAQIRDEVESEPYRLYDFALFDENYENLAEVNGSQIIGFQQLMRERTEYLRNHVVYNFVPPQLGDVAHDIAGEAVTFTARSADAQTVWLYHRADTFHPWHRTALQPAEDGLWSAELPLAQAREYYLVAEGEKAARVFPERASKEFLSVTAK
jgi:hypothetical protein